MDAIGNAVSGMRAASLRLDVASNNLANLSTPAFTPDLVALGATAGGGVTATVLPGQAPPTLPGVAASAQPSGTDPIDAMVELIEAPIAYAANARVVGAADDATASLFDALG